MPPKIYCKACEALYSIIPKSWRGDVPPPSREAMKRLYVRRASGTYSGTGYICDVGHVTLDDGPEGCRHRVIPAIPARVVCLNTGEVVTPED